MNLIYISLIVCYVIDLSGIIDSIESKVKLTKPFNCSRCMTLWTTLFYVVISSISPIEKCYGLLSIPMYKIFLCFMLSFMSDIMTNILMLVRDIFANLLFKLNKKLF